MHNTSERIEERWSQMFFASVDAKIETKVPTHLKWIYRVHTSIIKDSEVSINRSSRRKPVALGVDEATYPQATESLVTDDIGVVVEIRQDLLQIFGTFCFRGIPEPELWSKKKD